MLLQLDFSTATPIYQQIRDQIVRGIAEGELAPGEPRFRHHGRAADAPG